MQILNRIGGNGFLLVAFLLVWFVYYSLIVGFNFHSIYSNFGLAIIYQVIFIVLATLPLVLLPKRTIGRTVEPASRPDNARLTITVGLLLSILAISSLYLDKVMSGVDYSRGICFARSQMTQMGAGGGDGSSLLGVFGNLLAASFFVSVGVAMTRRVGRRVFYITVILSFACLIVFSFIASSRSTIMLLGAFCGGLICLRPWLGLPVPKLRWRDGALLLILLGLAGGYVLAVFDCRAQASYMDAEQYKESFGGFLGTEVSASSVPQTEIGEQSSAIVTTRVSGLIGITVLYAVHSAYTFAGIISLPPDDGRVLFEYALSLIARTGLIDPPNPSWSLAGRFASLPGGLYHDFGLVGLILGALLLGVLTWASAELARKFPSSTLVLGVVSGVYTIMLLSPIHFAAEFMTFPFVAASFVIVPLLVWIIETLSGLLKGLGHPTQS